MPSSRRHSSATRRAATTVATALADDLERYLDSEPVRAQADSRTYRLNKFAARNRLPVAAASAIVVALGIGLGVALWQGNEARTQAQRATALNTFVLSLIRTADPNASAQTKAADVAMLNTIEQRIDSEFKGSADQLLQLRVTVGDAYKNRGERPRPSASTSARSTKPHQSCPPMTCSCSPHACARPTTT